MEAPQFLKDPTSLRGAVVKAVACTAALYTLHLTYYGVNTVISENKIGSAEHTLELYHDPATPDSIVAAQQAEVDRLHITQAAVRDTQLIYAPLSELAGAGALALGQALWARGRRKATD